MTNFLDDLFAEHKERYEPLPSMAAVLGEDLGPSAYGDVEPAQEPAQRSTAATMARRTLQERAEATIEHQRQQLDRHAQHEREDEALEKYTRLHNNNQVPDQGTVILAARALARRGGSGLSSAEELARRPLARLRREQAQTDDDEQRRRQGRRPRG